MPLIRLARDKRGMDTLYLLHHGPDGRGDTRLRVIYFCAGPQGLAFGRQALDPVTQRALEQRYPDVAFDWTGLLQEVEQRRLPPQIEPQAKRIRPSSKAERRPTASETPVEKPSGGKKKRRRGGGQPGVMSSNAVAAATTSSSPSPSNPIIE